MAESRHVIDKSPFLSATMVTATLPCLSDDSDSSDPETEQPALLPSHNARDSVALSVESELTITPERYRSNGPETPQDTSSPAQDKPAVLAGYVGLFTGLGALVSLIVFLPLPSQFNKIEGVEIGEAVQYAYYVVGSISILVASFVYIGLRKLKGEEGKGFRTLFGLKKRKLADGSEAPKRSFLPYRQLLREAVVLGFTDSQIGLGYLGGFVARASTVAISAFIPLFVKRYYLDHISDGDQHKAYILASILTGVAQLFALIFAPVFGYLSRRRGRFNYPIVVATAFGIIGYISFPHVSSPEIKNVDGRGGSPAVFVLVALIGISQIGAIVCSLGSLGKGVLSAEPPNNNNDNNNNRNNGREVPLLTDNYQDDDDSALDVGEDASLLPNGSEPATTTSSLPSGRTKRVLLKGTIAGVYSWCGGAAILLLTKLGGFLFDKTSYGAPFYMMAAFNALLLVVTLAVDASKLAKDQVHKRV